MGDESLIGWTRHTSNGWIGCEKVSPGCRGCYAETSTPVRVKRASDLELWGGAEPRSETKGWRSDLRRWNRDALGSGEVVRVFAQSLSDTFEAYEGGDVRRANGRSDATLDGLRAEYLAELEACSALTVQLLTKRGDQIRRMVPAHWLENWPAHIAIGVSVENEETAEDRILHLAGIPAPVRFLSVEPQLEAIDLWRWLQWPGLIQWVIQGGESGGRARPFDLAWARQMRAACKAAGVAYFLKQLGAQPMDRVDWSGSFPTGQRLRLRDSHGGDASEWPTDLKSCRAFPVAA